MERKKEYRSAIRSRRMIRQAFLELLREKPFEKITVTDIVNRADINRSTFYAHFPDVRGLVDEIQKEVVESSVALISELDFHSIFKDSKPFFRKLLNIGVENRELFKLLGQSHFAYQQLEKMKAVFVQKAMSIPEIPEEMRLSKQYAVRINFFIGGIINTYQQWVQGTLDCTTDEIVEDISKLITSSAETILESNLN